MVSIQSELGVIKIQPEMYDGPYNNKTFPLIWRVVAFNLVVTSGCVGDNIFLTLFIKLANNNTNTKSTLVSV
jgi:hypothetical protein